MNETVGFIGLGTMGMPMAANLAKAGVRLVVHDANPAAAAAAGKLDGVTAAKRGPAAAVHQLLFPELVASNVVLTSARDVHAPVVAEHVIAQIFALAKQIPACVRYQQQRIWAQQLLWDSTPRPQEVMGSTLGLVGLGAIGNEVVQRANALGMKVIAVREHPEKPAKGVDAVYAPQDLNKLLSQADFVVLAAPVTSSTQPSSTRNASPR